MAMHSLEIDYRRLGSTLWQRQNNDVTANFKSKSICSKRSRNYFESIEKRDDYEGHVK